MERIGVIGGGVVGLCCALRLRDAGHDVTVFDGATTRSAASWNNAGHIAVEQVAPLASPANVRSLPGRLFAFGGPVGLPPGAMPAWLPFALGMLRHSTRRRHEAGRAALSAILADAMPAWRRLADDIARPELLRADGHFVVWHDPAAARKGRRSWLAADIGTARARDAAAADLARLATVMRTPPAEAIRIEGSGQIADLDALAEALEHAVEAGGGRIVRAHAALGARGGRATIGDHGFDAVLVAAGAASAAPMRAAGHRVPLVAERGYHIRAAAADWPADLPPVVFEDRAMIVTRYADTVQASGFVEFAAADRPADPRKFERLERAVGALGLPIAGPFDRWMGARPTLPDYLPAIGRSRRLGNLYYAFGHQHLGLTLAATTAEIVAALVAGATPAGGLDRFDIERFARGRTT